MEKERSEKAGLLFSTELLRLATVLYGENKVNEVSEMPGRNFITFIPWRRKLVEKWF